MALFDVADNDVTESGVEIDVEDAKDAAGNDQQDYDSAAAGGKFDIDTAAVVTYVTSVTAGPDPVTDGDVGSETFTVTVVFNAAMNTGETPTIIFNPTLGTTLAFSSALWSVGDTTYTAKYDVSDGNVDHDDVEIDVEDAEDAGSGPQQDYTPEREFGVDQLNPTVSGVAASPVLVVDDDLGVGNFTVTVDFSEAMTTNGTADPALTFNPTVGTTLSLDSGSWPDDDTYVALYTVADADVTETDVEIDVTLAKDAAGNGQQDYTPQAEFSIDTEDPTVTDVAVNDTLLEIGDMGEGNFVVTVTFSEAMDTGTTPALTFAPSVPSILSGLVGGWPNSTTYTARYDVAGSATDVNDVTIDVAGAEDANGNGQKDYSPVSEFSIAGVDEIVVLGGVTTVTNEIAGTNFVIFTFTTDGFLLTPEALDIDYLVVAGGGGGAGAYGGGGGAGGLLSGSTNLPPQVYTITVGTGGGGGVGSGPGNYNLNIGTTGANSSISNATAAIISASGGGGGGSRNAASHVGRSGGSGGGGGGHDGGTGGAGNTPATIPSQGNNGGNGINAAGSSAGGGGGGAGGPGGAAASGVGGSKGAATSISITTGSPVEYAEGGGGGGPNTDGIGGGATIGIDGLNGTGGGGGGGDNSGQAGHGGDGIVIVRYALPPVPQGTLFLLR